jgi:hypothetical protein
VPTATPSPAPATPTAAPQPSPSPAPAITATPAPAPTEPVYKVVLTPPPPGPGLPAILEIDMLDTTVHAGGTYSVRVKTTLDVTTLNVTALGTTLGMQAARPGLFATDGTVPTAIPFFLLNRSYTVTITALSADGKSTSFPVTIRLER